MGANTCVRCWWPMASCPSVTVTWPLSSAGLKTACAGSKFPRIASSSLPTCAGTTVPGSPDWPSQANSARAATRVRGPRPISPSGSWPGCASAIRDLVTCSQGDIDTWFAQGPSTCLQARSFLSWSVRTHRREALELPPDRPATPRGIPEHERLDLLSRFLGDDDVDLVDRVAGCLVLLYALPLTRINRLRTSDFEQTDGALALRTGEDLVPVPSPVAVLVGTLAERSRHVTGAGHPDSDWLFPGARAGHPIESDQLAERLNRHGVTRAARTAALDALLATVPAPVLAKLLDRKPWRVADRTKILGTDWRNYVALRVQSRPDPRGIRISR